MSAPTDAEMKADLMAQIVAYRASNPEPKYDRVLEERMAHVANGGALRAVPVGRSIQPMPKANTSRDERGFEHHGFGNYIWTGQPE
jgi:hypothetical protein